MKAAGRVRGPCHEDHERFIAKERCSQSVSVHRFKFEAGRPQMAASVAVDTINR